jgi:hypothetical protein
MEAIVGIALAWLAFVVLKAILPGLLRAVRALIGMTIVVGGYVAAAWLLLTATEDGIDDAIYGAALFGVIGIVVAHRAGRWVGGWPRSAPHEATPGHPSVASVPLVHQPPPPPVRPICYHCGGSGKVACYMVHYPGSPPCGVCNGSMQISCPACRGL